MERITKEMTVEEVLDRYPKTTRVFMEFKIPSLVCGEPLWGTVEEVAQRYKVNLAELLNRLNQNLDEKIG